MDKKFTFKNHGFLPRPLAAAALFVFSIFLLSSCDPPKEPVFKSIEDIQVTSLGMQEINIKANALMFNPNPVSIHLKKAVLDISVNDIPMGKIEKEYNLELPANETTKFPVEIKGDTKELLKGKNLFGAMSIFSGDKINLKYKGKVEVEAIKIKFEIPVDFNGEVDRN